MKMTSGPQKEYGGFLPLELNPGKEWFAAYQSCMMRFNTVKASLFYALKGMGVSKIYMPYYYCPTTIEAVKRSNIRVLFYHIDRELQPEGILDNADTAVLLVNYFGIMDKKVEALADTFRQSKVIIDNAQAFYCPPVMRKNVVNLYSAKKFFGIPDGSYVIGSGVTHEEQEETYAEEYAQYLLTTYEKGTNAAYASKKRVDEMLAANFGPMTKLSLGLLQNVDYERVYKRRCDNYSLFAKAFAGRNHLQIPKTCAAYHYPLLPGESGLQVKQKLIQDRIYVPTLWEGEDLLKEGNTFERDMSRNAVFLPMDQRYGEDDIAYIIAKVKEYDY